MFVASILRAVKHFLDAVAYANRLKAERMVANHLALTSGMAPRSR